MVIYDIRFVIHGRQRAKVNFHISRYRRVIQLLFFVIFVFLLLAAVKRTPLPVPYQIFLQFDPLLALAGLIVGVPLLAALAYSLITVIITLLLGRVYCGYACPMGSVLDVFSPLARILKIKPASLSGLKTLPLMILAVVVTLGFFNIGVLLALDPMSLITRMSVVVVEYVTTISGLFNSESFMAFAREQNAGSLEILSYGYSKIFYSSDWIIFSFLFIIGLNILGKRFWCRYLCPLGGLLGLLSRVPLWRRKADPSLCTDCGICVKTCDMNAAAPAMATDAASCVLCLKCRERCPSDAVSLGLKPELTKEMPSRRSAIAILASGLAAAAFTPLRVQASIDDPTLIRPPGVEDEELFLGKCSRCQECLMACPTGALRPAFLQYGFEALWTPHLDFSVDVCDFKCNACTQSCPTGAIKKLDILEKQSFAIGTAKVFNDKCILWVKGTGCGICVESCPLRGQAIKMRTEPDRYGRMRKIPVVFEDSCIGCGICEAVCPIQGEKAIKVLKIK